MLLTVNLPLSFVKFKLHNNHLVELLPKQWDLSALTYQSVPSGLWYLLVFDVLWEMKKTTFGFTVTNKCTISTSHKYCWYPNCQFHFDSTNLGYALIIVQRCLRNWVRLWTSITPYCMSLAVISVTTEVFCRYLTSVSWTRFAISCLKSLVSSKYRKNLDNISSPLMLAWQLVHKMTQLTKTAIRICITMTVAIPTLPKDYSTSKRLIPCW